MEYVRRSAEVEAVQAKAHADRDIKELREMLVKIRDEVYDDNRGNRTLALTLNNHAKRTEEYMASMDKRLETLNDLITKHFLGIK